MLFITSTLFSIPEVDAAKRPGMAQGTAITRPTEPAVRPGTKSHRERKSRDILKHVLKP